MKWIKTSDSLPERVPKARYSQVWCLCVHDGEVMILVFNHEHMCWDDRSGDDFFCSIGDVSHWMLLPEAPTAGQEESPKTAHNSDYATALRIIDEYVGSPLENFNGDFQGFITHCQQRLNSAKAPNCS